MIKVRGNRIHYTPSIDAELPESERRVFSFINPTVAHFDRLWQKCIEPGEGDKQRLDVSKFVLSMLRGWANVRTDDPVVASKYGQSEAIPPEGLVLAFDPGRPLALGDLFELVTQDVSVELVNTVFETVNPTPSGNSELPSGSQPAISAPDAGQVDATPISPAAPTT